MGKIHFGDRPEAIAAAKSAEPSFFVAFLQRNGIEVGDVNRPQRQKQTGGAGKNVVRIYRLLIR
jgi:hypothetical protein